MKATGIARKVDELGRVVLPIELMVNTNFKSDKTILNWTRE